MAFTLERDMYTAMASHIHTLFEADQRRGISRTFNGRPVGFVVPDFLHVRALHDNWGITTHKMTVLDASIVAELLKVKRLSAELIAARLFAAPKRVDSRLRLLANVGILGVQAGQYYATRRHSLAGVKVIAVEVKLRRWQQALKQAMSYLRFANQSYIAMPEHVVASNLRIQHACRAAGVGVLAVGQSATTMLHRARRQKVQSAEWVWLVARALSDPCSRVNCNSD